jgi:hypothetical protein
MDASASHFVPCLAPQPPESFHTIKTHVNNTRLRGRRQGALRADGGNIWARSDSKLSLHFQGSHIKLLRFSAVSNNAWQLSDRFHARRRAPPLRSLRQKFGTRGNGFVGGEKENRILACSFPSRSPYTSLMLALKMNPLVVCKSARVRLYSVLLAIAWIVAGLSLCFSDAGCRDIMRGFMPLRR